MKHVKHHLTLENMILDFKCCQKSLTTTVISGLSNAIEALIAYIPLLNITHYFKYRLDNLFMY